jgi:hypothetical protein
MQKIMRENYAQWSFMQKTDLLPTKKSRLGPEFGQAGRGNERKPLTGGPRIPMVTSDPGKARPQHKLH